MDSNFTRRRYNCLAMALTAAPIAVLVHRLSTHPGRSRLHDRRIVLDGAPDEIAGNRFGGMDRRSSVSVLHDVHAASARGSVASVRRYLDISRYPHRHDQGSRLDEA
jgi:hypothetical protein